jgi:hypothetical protein
MSTLPTLPEAIWRSLWKYIVGFVSFPIVARGSGLLLESARRRWEAASAARRVISTQLDPLLKAADELQGKLRSLAEEDFQEFRLIPKTDATATNLVNLCSTLYLFAQFWARLEILRRESFHAELTKNRQGKLLMSFLRCLESKHVRLVDRAWQRAIGESVFAQAKPPADVITFKEFVEQYEDVQRFREWVRPLEEILRETRFRRARQRLLQYGVIVHALIDTLDPKHHTTRERPAYPNKLSRRAKRDLIGRVFGTYLQEVKDVQKYTGVSSSTK